MIRLFRHLLRTTNTTMATKSNQPAFKGALILLLATLFWPRRRPLWRDVIQLLGELRFERSASAAAGLGGLAGSKSRRRSPLGHLPCQAFSPNNDAFSTAPDNIRITGSIACAQHQHQRL